MPVWTKRSVVALALVSLSLLLVPTPAGRDGVQTLVQVGCLALAWYHVRRHRSVIRLGWGLLVVAVTLLGFSDVLAALERHFHVFVHGPTPSNVVALTGYVLLGLSVLQLDRNRSRGRRLPGATEAAIFATGALAPV